ncbi:serine protease [Burkholderia sp. AU30280]|uniref:S1 family peptidase n=1 Tax=Burkholderia sp. AU30280 TaxID=2879628 RepID=UPI001CF40B4A|nr:serine protease [Burkholderia sp. AU30280]MCA8275739.1 serine protease [Burkholderia sp. AU30280]
MLEELYNRISPACCYITVFLDDEKISEGTGYSFTTDGQVLTAAHVVTGRFPILLSDYTDPALKIFCKFPGLPVAEYVVVMCCLEIQVPGLSENIQLDLAVLHAKAPLPSAPPHIPVTVDESPRLGQRVIMAGYSEELSVPFSVDRLLSPTAKGADAFKAAMEKGYMADMTGPLIKQGHVANLRRIVASVASRNLECDLVYIDNAMHPGASGGPLINERGEAIGVLSQRAVTAVDGGKDGMIKVPSGCTVAISLLPLKFFA